MVVVALLFVLGLSLVLLGGYRYPPLHDLTAAFEWDVTLVVFLALNLLLSRRLKHRSHVWALLVLSWFFLIPTALALATGGRMVLNGWWDQSAETRHTTLIVDAYRATGSIIRPGGYPRVQVQAWRSGEPDIWLDVSEDLYAAVAPDDVVAVETKAGWLGVEWVVDVHVRRRVVRRGGNDR